MGAVCATPVQVMSPPVRNQSKAASSSSNEAVEDAFSPPRTNVGPPSSSSVEPVHALDDYMNIPSREASPQSLLLRFNSPTSAPTAVDPLLTYAANYVRVMADLTMSTDRSSAENSLNDLFVRSTAANVTRQLRLLKVHATGKSWSGLDARDRT